MGLRDPAVHDQPVGRPPSKFVLTYARPQWVLQTGVAANAAGLYASAHGVRTVRVWDPRQGALVRASLPSHKGWVSAGVSIRLCVCLCVCLRIWGRSALSCAYSVRMLFVPLPNSKPSARGGLNSLV